jgi:glyoxylase-like metal-dependent hydrolase (beta-lactamase superfamily II)
MVLAPLDDWGAGQVRGLISGCTVGQFELGPMQNLVYLVVDWAQREALVVDPQRDVETLFSALQEHQVSLRGILLTHTHFDHTAGVPEILNRQDDLPVMCHALEAHRLGKQGMAPRHLKLIDDHERLRVGAINLDVIHTPGHSAGGVCFLVHAERPFLLTGDTVFVRDCGRTDLDTGSPAQMFASLQRLKTLPGNCVVLPGHHYAPECASTLADEWRDSPPFRVKTVAELAQLP